MEHNVFISFSSKDTDKAHRVYDALTLRGIKCWISSRDIPAGGNYQNEIVKALTAAKAMVLVYSVNANSSEEIQKEVSLAAANGLALMPLKIGDFEPSGGFIYSLATSQWVYIDPDFDSADFDKKLDGFAADVKTALEKGDLFALHVRQAIEDDGVVGTTERKFLEEAGAKIGLTAKQAATIVDEVIGRSSPLNIEKGESQYLQVVTEVLEDGIVSSIERKHLAEKAKSLGISDERAQALLEQERAKRGVSVPARTEAGKAPRSQAALGSTSEAPARTPRAKRAEPKQVAKEKSDTVSVKRTAAAAIAVTTEVCQQLPAPVPASSPAGPPPTPASPGRNGGLSGGVIVSGILVIGLGVFFAFQPLSKSTAPDTFVATSTAHVPATAPAINPASQFNPGDARQLPVASEPATAPVDAALDRQDTAQHQAKQAAAHLEAMLDGARTNSEARITAAVDAIKQLPLPPRGDRKTARAANDAGLAALNRDAFDEAIARFDDAIKADPADQEIVNNRGYALMMAGRLPDAIAAFQQALTLAPTRSSAWANLAVAFAKVELSADGFAAYMLAFRFSQNQIKTREFLAKQSQEDLDPKVRELAATVLTAVGSE